MRLLHTETLRLRQFDEEPFPEYAILSHRWGDQEISFQELETGLGTEKQGYRKVETFCTQAKQRGFEWCWVDTCGIDKTSSAELSEAINSMYKWYEQSAVCFVYLPDVSAQDLQDGSPIVTDFADSCWFTRGWTLQELIAPGNVEFYTSDWVYIGDKASKIDEVSDITGIDPGVLDGRKPVRSCSVAKIMSWASQRVTTRKEDIAYCLMGLFGIYMPLLYGEGDRAFIRLQEEILKQSSDQSLFAWNPLDEAAEVVSSGKESKDSYCGIFATSPACFAESWNILQSPEYWDTESALTNRGIRLRMPFKYDVTTEIFTGILCCTSSARDVAIEFFGASTSFEDLDHLIRRSSKVKIGNWSNDPQIQFNQVYLATETSLSRVRYFGLHSLKPESEFHVLLRDRHHLASLDGPPEIHPAKALVPEPLLNFKDMKDTRELFVLNPLKPSYRVAIMLPTKSMGNIALIFGFATLKNGLPDLPHTWIVLLKMPDQQSLEEVWSSVTEPPLPQAAEAAQIIIDRVCISAKITQQSWWARTSQNVSISVIPSTRVVDSLLHILAAPMGGVKRLNLRTLVHNHLGISPGVGEPK